MDYQPIGGTAMTRPTLQQLMDRLFEIEEKHLSDGSKVCSLKLKSVTFEMTCRPDADFLVSALATVILKARDNHAFVEIK